MEKKKLSEAERLGVVFELFAQAAAAKERCPTNEQIRKTFVERGIVAYEGKGFSALPPRAPARLAEAGRIRVEVYGRNWRVVQITEEGPYYGKRTKEDPSGGEPYKVLKASKPSKSSSA